MGVKDFGSMHTSVTSAWQFVECIDKTLVDHLKNELSKCPFVGLSMDESTSMAVQKYLSVDCHAWMPAVGRLVTVLDFCLLPDSTAQGVYDATMNLLTKFGINNKQKFIGAASDGASVFTGTCSIVCSWLVTLFAYLCACLQAT